MAVATPILGTGTSIAFGTSGFGALVDYESIRIKPGARPVVQTTPLVTTLPAQGDLGGHTYIPGKLQEGAKISVEIQYQPAVGRRPPIHAAAETITITWPDGSTLVGSGFIFEMDEIVAGIDGLLKTTIHIQATGIWR